MTKTRPSPLDLLTELIGEAHIRPPANDRPEYTLRWGHNPNFQRLRLELLGNDNASEMLAALLGQFPGPVAPQADHYRDDRFYPDSSWRKRSKRCSTRALSSVRMEV